MRIRGLASSGAILVLVLASTVLSVPTAMAATVTLIEEGIAAGIEDLGVDGRLYDIEFVLGRPTDLYGPDLSMAPFASYGEAEPFAMAIVELFNQERVEVVLGFLNPYPNDFIIATRTSNSVGSVEAAGGINSGFDSGGWSVGQGDFSINEIDVYTNVALVPLPAGLPLLASALALIGFAKHRLRAQRGR
jgi:hypothetical protein